MIGITFYQNVPSNFLEFQKSKMILGFHAHITVWIFFKMLKRSKVEWNSIKEVLLGSSLYFFVNSFDVMEFGQDHERFFVEVR